MKIKDCLNQKNCPNHDEECEYGQFLLALRQG